MVAEQMEALWATLMPLTHAAFRTERPGLPIAVIGLAVGGSR